MRPRRGKKPNASEQEAMEASGSGGETVAPTAQLSRIKTTQELQIYKLKIEWQEQRIEDLVKERDFLKEQLATALKKGVIANSAPKQVLTLSSGSGSSEENSTSVDSMGSSDESDEELKAPKKTKNGKKKMRKKMKKQKKKEAMEQGEKRSRAKDPDHVVARYQKIARIYRRGGTMSSAFKRCNVDRNTIVATAPIAELQIAAPHKYEELEQRRPQKLSEFAAQCDAAIKEDPEIKDQIKVYKTTGKLLPLKSKDDMP